jgi:hypothetical protein
MRHLTSRPTANLGFVLQPLELVVCASRQMRVARREVVIVLARLMLQPWGEGGFRYLLLGA